MVGRSLVFLVWYYIVTLLTESVVSMKVGDSDVVIGYQVDEYLWVAIMSAALVASVSLVSILQAGNLAKGSALARY